MGVLKSQAFLNGVHDGFFFYRFAGGVDVLTSLTVTEAQYNNNQVELTLSDGRKVGKTENKCNYKYI